VAATGRCAVPAGSQCSAGHLSSGGGQSAVAFHHVPGHRAAAAHASHYTQLNDPCTVLSAPARR